MLRTLTNFNLRTQFGAGIQPVVENKFTEGATTDPFINLETVISFSIGFITILAGIFFIFQFVTASFSMVTTGGDVSKLNAARDKMLHGVLGLIIVVASYAIIGLVGTIVGLDLLSPAEQLEMIIPGQTI